ncbi:MAG: hypothetical protein RL226_377 [Bacteroidota bacterium]|jgi:hypothetical protein
MDVFIMFLGFALAAYSVVGNDVIQTLGTFLTSNSNRPWWVLWIFVAGLMTITLVLGYSGHGQFLGGDDVTFDRLDKIDIPAHLSLWYLIPPIVLLIITRFGIPVSTTFLILSFFSIKSLPGMVFKSLMGYAVAFSFAIVFYFIISKFIERKFRDIPLNENGGFWNSSKFWTAAQWASTSFLWVQWLTQDLANIFVYLGRPEGLSVAKFAIAMLILIAMVGFIFAQRGGRIQNIIKSKSNTADIRSATLIDFSYGLVLLIFMRNVFGIWDSKLPMSTTWVFLGLLAGREIAMRYHLGPKPDRNLSFLLFSDIGKAALGLVVSVTLVIFLFLVEGKDVSLLFSAN